MKFEKELSQNILFWDDSFYYERIQYFKNIQKNLDMVVHYTLYCI